MISSFVHKQHRPGTAHAPGDRDARGARLARPELLLQKFPPLSRVTGSLCSCLSQGRQQFVSRRLSTASCPAVNFMCELRGTAPFLLISQPELFRGNKLLQKLHLFKCGIHSKASTHSFPYKNTSLSSFGLSWLLQPMHYFSVILWG